MNDAKQRLLCGTYTKGESVGIYPMYFAPRTARLSLAGDPCRTLHPSFLALHPHRPFVYAVNELAGRGGVHGRVSAFRIAWDADREVLTPVGDVSSGGNAPCHIAVDGRGAFAVVANYADGRVALVPISKDGTLGEPCHVVQHQGRSVHPQRQTGPHAHSTLIDEAHDLVYAADLGLDRILIYRLDRTAGKLLPADPPSAATRPGAGPRHMARHPNGAFLFAIDELDSTVTVFRRAADNPAALEPAAVVSTLPEGFEGHNTCADIHIHPSGRTVYGSNRGHDSIVVFRFHPETGRLKPVQFVSTRGKHPRNFTLSPDARFLLAANQNTFNITIFRVRPEDGLLDETPVGEATVPYPVCLVFDQGGTTPRP